MKDITNLTDYLLDSADVIGGSEGRLLKRAATEIKNLNLQIDSLNLLIEQHRRVIDDLTHRLALSNAERDAVCRGMVDKMIKGELA